MFPGDHRSHHFPGKMLLLCFFTFAIELGGKCVNLMLLLRSRMQLGCGKAATAFVSCPSREHNSKALSTDLHTDWFFFFFCLYPHCEGRLSEQWKLYTFCVRYRV